MKATVSGVFEDLKFKISEGSDQNWSCPDSALLAVSSNLMWSAAAALWDELMSINITIYHLGTLMSMLKPDTTKRNIKNLSYKVCLKVPLALYSLFSCCHWAWCCFITKMQYTSNIWWSKGFVYLLGVSCPSFKIFVAPKDKNSNTRYFFISFLQNKHKY